jgi:hypothetical protein
MSLRRELNVEAHTPMLCGAELSRLAIHPCSAAEAEFPLGSDRPQGILAKANEVNLMKTLC